MVIAALVGLCAAHVHLRRQFRRSFDSAQMQATKLQSWVGVQEKLLQAHSDQLDLLGAHADKARDQLRRIFPETPGASAAASPEHPAHVPIVSSVFADGSEQLTCRYCGTPMGIRDA